MTASSALSFETVTETARTPSRPATGRALSVTLRRLTKAFDGGEPVIRGLDLHMPAGQFVAIVGRSGCGKSTLLRLILGLEEPSAGRISLDGRESRDTGALRRIMFQEPRLLPTQ
ncbi:hypothetical protein GCM10007887_40460 [Methylobacterium haplocladii]|nr:hypothetical protein GCM10007887_40460 [Methylobacterium haplocladii]